MLYSIDVSGYRSKRSISALTEDAVNAVKKAGIKGVEISQQGDIFQVKGSFKTASGAPGPDRFHMI